VRRKYVTVLDFGIVLECPQMGRNVDATPRRFSTLQYPERERLARWREEFGRTLVGVDIVPCATDAPFWAEAILQNLPGVGLAAWTGSTVQISRTSALIAADTKAGETVGLIVNIGTSPSPIRQYDTELVLSEGSAVLVRHEEACVLPAATNFVGLVLPRAALAARTDNLNSAFMRELSHEESALRLLLNYIRLIQSDPGLGEPALHQAVGNHVHDLAALSLGVSRDARERAKRSAGAARLKQAVAYIGRHFAEQDLTIQSVAKRQDISPRYLQQLLEQSGASFTARVSELRLKRAYALLTRFPDRQVAGIALEAGFANVSHFNRLFRARFGDSPSGVRGSG
jgi:AraC-like DNA-binding protein